jgi:hypothetical protein
MNLVATCGHCGRGHYERDDGSICSGCSCLEGHNLLIDRGDDGIPIWRVDDQISDLQKSINAKLDEILLRCECGAEAAGTPHVKWCPKYKPLPGDY